MTKTKKIKANRKSVPCWSYDDANAWPCWANSSDRTWLGVMPEYTKDVMLELMANSQYYPQSDTEDELIFNCKVAPLRKGIVAKKLENGHYQLDDMHRAANICNDLGEPIRADGSLGPRDISVVHLINNYRTKHNDWNWWS